MLLYVMWQLQACAGSVVVRLCEGEFGITRREWRVLAQLAAHEGVQSSELARHASLDRARTSRALTGLVAKGLVERTPREGDRREVLVHLTAQGRALHAALLPRVAQINRELLSALDEGEVRQLVRFLERLQRQAEAMRADRAP
ncbi:MAG: MarR family transcriptional regulator [Burkholderiaceae bacterium]|nr:MarR family transcriptional regulator [Pseudomonadota bacterium]MBS0598481.1 MarR family transcriptional regulator [Pseudomonadota bacterium]MCP5220010.1 MarR family transcriptional regulator [Burkholderiaceae bacterium]